MPRSSIHTIASLVILIPALASAQVPSADTLRLTVDESIARALTASPRLARERLEVQRARAERIGVAAFFPEPPEIEYGRRSDLPFANEGEGGWELGLSQEIELGGQSALREDAADLLVGGVEYRVRSAELDVRAEAREAFARLMAAEARVRLFDTLLAFARRLDTAAGRLFNAEEISELERNAIRLERGRTEMERLEGVADLAAARAELGVIVGASNSVVVPMGTPSDENRVRAALETAAAVDSALAAGDTTIFASRPEWQALERLRERAAVERRLASRALVPNVRVGLALESETATANEHDFTSGGETAVTGLSFRDEDMVLGFSIGVSLPIPIPRLYDVGLGAAAVAEADLAIATAEQRILATRIRSDVARATARLRPVAEALLLYRRDMAPLITRNLELLERGYRSGELGATELIPQQQQFAGAAGALIQAELEFNEAYADFERALGR